MHQFRDVPSMIAFCNATVAKKENLTIGFVPTMGNLHAGHAALISKSVEETDVTIVSIFLNRLQFAPHEDLDKYPRTEADDLVQCESLGVHATFLPSACDMYGADHMPPFATAVSVSTGDAQCNAQSEGASRPLFFRGVATAVAKLLNVVQPTHVFFGQKDAQQVAVIRRLLIDLYPRIALRVGDTTRAASGLALSSRNAYLSDAQRERASLLFRALALGKRYFDEGGRSANAIRDMVTSCVSHDTDFLGDAKADADTDANDDADTDANDDADTDANDDAEVEVEPIALNYVSVCDRWSMREIDDDVPDDQPCLICIAAKVGPARLIDNIVLQQ